MTHTLKISFGKDSESRENSEREKIVTFRKVSIREKLLRFLFGGKTYLTVIVPGDTVEEMAIKEVGKEVTNETV